LPLNLRKYKTLGYSATSACSLALPLHQEILPKGHNPHGLAYGLGLCPRPQHRRPGGQRGRGGSRTRDPERPLLPALRGVCCAPRERGGRRHDQGTASHTEFSPRIRLEKSGSMATATQFPEYKIIEDSAGVQHVSQKEGKFYIEVRTSGWAEIDGQVYSWDTVAKDIPVNRLSE